MSKNRIQVDSQHYKFDSYMDERRWSSIWYQIREILALQPQEVLEIGPGTGLLKACLSTFGINISTLDIDPALNPDILASAVEMPVPDKEFDICCAFQVLEHFKFSTSVEVFSQMVRVSRRYLLLSLPDARRRWPFSVYVPKVGIKQFIINVPRKRVQHQFDGQHYWELGKKNYDEDAVINSLASPHNLTLIKKFSAPQNPYHRFFVFKKNEN